MTEKKTTKKQSKYKVVLEFKEGYSFRGEGETIQEAILSMNLSWNMIKLNGTITVKKGKKQAEQLFTAKKIKDLLNRKNLRDIWADKFEFRLQ